MSDFWKVVKGGLVLVVVAMLCGLAYGSCRAVVTLMDRAVTPVTPEAR